MIWRLMASVLVVLETGSVSRVSDATDWPSEQACIQVVQNIYSVPPTAQVIGSSTNHQDVGILRAGHPQH